MTFPTVGYVSGFIALAVFLIQIFLPDLITLIIVDRLGYKQTAATWSVASCGLQEYLWPTLLRSDSAASKTVNSKVKALLWFSQSFTYVISIAAIFTPLGLYSIWDFSETSTLVPFIYAKDYSNIGKGTEARSPDFRFGRRCGGIYTCPDVGDKTSLVPQLSQTSLTLYESGLTSQAPTVSSIFDIQWRKYSKEHYEEVEQNSSFILGGYQQLQIYLPRQGLRLFEGLVVDYNEGGIGFRNHSLPENSGQDSQWEEDLLFLEPETACVDTNLTLQHYVDKQGEDQLLLVDRGGFIHLARDSPNQYYNEDTQQNPELLSRAWRAAWWNNYMTMVYLNVTTPPSHPWEYLNTSLGKIFPLIDKSDGYAYYAQPHPDRISTGGFGSYIPEGFRFDSFSHLYANPFKITAESFNKAGAVCRGAVTGVPANITTLAIGCGLLNATPRLAVIAQDAPQSADGKVWETSLYSCANAVKVSIKTVKFRYIASRGNRLGALKAESLKNKKYKSPSHMPYWGVENYDMKFANENPLWGLVDKEAASANISLLQSERLYLPGTTYTVDEFDTSGDPRTTPASEMNLPGANFYRSTLKSLYEFLDDSYTGYNNPSMARRWKDMTALTNSSAKMLDLIWTDIAANAVYGSRGWLSVPQNFSDEKQSQSSFWEYRKSSSVPVHLYTKQVRCHWLFTIPAFVAIGGFLCLVLLAAVAFIYGKGKPSHIADYLRYVSSGRLMGRNAFNAMRLSTKDWSEADGSQIIDIRQIGKIPEKDSSSE